MEFIICMLLASVITGVRPIADTIQALKGVDPPHLQKARLKAQERAEVRAAEEARRAGRARKPGDDKPTLLDVARVYRGNVWQDAIDHIERSKAEKRAQRAANAQARLDGTAPQEVRPPLKERAKRTASLLWGPVGETPAEPVVAEVPQDITEPGDMPARTACEDCGQTLVQRDGGWQHRSSAGCPSPAAEPPPGRPARTATSAPSPSAGRGPRPSPEERDAETQRRQAAEVAEVLRRREWEQAEQQAREEALHQRAGAPDRDAWRDAEQQRRRAANAAERQRRKEWHDAERQARKEALQPTPAPVTETAAQNTAGTEPTSTETTNGGNTMTQSTGEAVNYETTVAELEAMIARLQAHLDAAITAAAKITETKGAINDAQTSYNPAAAAAQSIHEHLTAKGLDSDTTSQTGTLTDSLPPNEVNVMFDQLEAMEARANEAKEKAEIALAAATQALATVHENYGDHAAAVAQKLGGDASFLNSSGLSSSGTSATGAIVDPPASRLGDGSVPSVPAVSTAHAEEAARMPVHR